MYGSFPNPGVGDVCKKYYFKNDYYYVGKKNYTKAMEYADSILFVIQEKGLEKKYVKNMGHALLRKGDAYMGGNNYTDAFKCYYEGKRYIETTRDTCLFTEFNGRLATVSYKQTNYKQAIYYYKEALENLSHCKEEKFLRFKEEQLHLDNIGLCFEKIGMTDSAISYYYKALNYLNSRQSEFPDEKHFIEIAKGVIYGNLGTSYFNKGEVDSAELFFKTNIQINTKKGAENEDAQITQAKLISLYLSSRQFTEASQLLSTLKLSLDTMPNDQLEVIWNKLQSAYYDSIGQQKEAYTYLSRYLMLQDTLNSRIKKLPGSDFNKEFESLDRQNMLDDVKKKSDLKTSYLLLLITFLLMALIILGMVNSNHKRTKKHMAELLLLNEKINTKNIELNQTLRSLEESHKDNSKMLNIVAHDLRSPINSISGFISLLMMDESNTEEQKEIYEIIKASCNHSTEMINDLLHINITPENIKKEKVEMLTLLRHSVDLLKLQAEKKSITLTLEAEPIEIQINQEKIWRVMSNLIVNAIKFTPEAGSILVKLQRNEQGILLSVKDTGIGIPENLKKGIFTMFSDSGRKGTAGEKNFGLGLSISKQIVEAHGGEIWFESEENKGTTFYVRLPN